MIRKAIERGVPEEKIALALDLNMSSIRRKVRLLDGICEEAVSILKDKPATGAVFNALRKMKTMRQIEAAELLVNANNYSVAYVSAILAGTPQAQLVEASKPKKVIPRRLPADLVEVAVVTELRRVMRVPSITAQIIAHLAREGHAQPPRPLHRPARPPCYRASRRNR